jgi:sarcosine oxidase
VTSNHYDVIVLGVGSMGAATCYHLARRGLKVLGLEQFSIPHEKGSYTGQTRIIRKAYFEHPGYVPLLHRAYSNWNDLEELSERKIYFKTGLVYIGAPMHPIIRGVKKASALFKLDVEELTHEELWKRYPQFHPEPGSTILLENDAGFLLPGLAITSYINEACRYGAIILSEEKTLGWKKVEKNIEVETEKGKYTASKLVITAGAWTEKVIPKLGVPIKITRQVMLWVKPGNAANYSPSNFPCWMIANNANGVYYGFPDFVEPGQGEPGGLKFALHYPGQVTDPDFVNRSVSPQEVEDIVDGLREYLPVSTNQVVATKTCLYSNSPDEDFIIDHLPGYEGTVSFACGFSGHGFKFASVIGEILADLSTDGETNLPIDFLRLKRFETKQ